MMATTSRKRSSTQSPQQYQVLCDCIVQVSQRAQAGAAGAVNRLLLLRNWIIGLNLVEYEQHGADRAAYGQRLLARLAADLTKREVGGCSAEMLGRMRSFYLACPRLRSQIPSSLMTKSSAQAISSSAMTESAKGSPPPLAAASILRLSWTHWIELLRLADPWKRAFYEQECLRGAWSVRQLQRQIGSLLFERTGLSTDRRTIIAEARAQADEAPQRIVDLIRDPYVLEFTGLAERPAYRESDLETAILDHLQAFLLELGGGFCFEARQRRITVGNEHDWIDLVFYHRRLRCHLLIELKTRAFQHGDAGQMNFYLNWWKKHEVEAGDQPPVGLLLCAGKDQAKVQYATAGLDQSLFVSRYLVALPKPEELQRLVDADQAAWQQRHSTEPQS